MKLSKLASRSLITYAAIPAAKKVWQKWENMPTEEKTKYKRQAKDIANKTMDKISHHKK